jgi:DNA-binding MarR family transcriptional regulator
MASEQVLTLAVRRHVIVGDRPFQDVMDAIYAGISQPDINGLFRQLAASTSYEQFSALVAQAQGSAGLMRFLELKLDNASPRVTDVAGRLSIDAPAVTRKAQQLERLGLVSRARDADDARASRLQLTPEGRRVLRRFLLAWHRWLTSLLADWPPAERREFARLMGRFTEDIHRHLDELDP